MMVDSDLDAQLSTMFMVQYDPDGVAGAHDHPFEETYLLPRGRRRGGLRRRELRARARRHRVGRGRLRARVPQRRRRPAALAGDPVAAAAEPALVPVRPRLGLPARSAGEGRRAWLSAARSWSSAAPPASGGRSPSAPPSAARGHHHRARRRPGSRRSPRRSAVTCAAIALDLSEPDEHRRGPGRRRTRRPPGDRRHRAGHEHGRRLRRRHGAAAGDAEAGRLHRGRSTRCCRAWRRTRRSCCSAGWPRTGPYPGSTTVSTINGGVVGMVHTLAAELAPIRVNAMHPGIVGDSPFWSGKPLDHVVTRTPLGPNGDDGRDRRRGRVPAAQRRRQRVDLPVDGGWMLEVKVAVIGTGRMGAAMAARLAASGVEVTVYNRTRPARRRWRPGSGPTVASHRAGGGRRGADVVLVSLADDAAVGEAYAGPDGIAAGVAHGDGRLRHQHGRPGDGPAYGGSGASGRRRRSWTPRSPAACRRSRAAAGHPGRRRHGRPRAGPAGARPPRVAGLPRSGRPAPAPR